MPKTPKATASKQSSRARSGRATAKKAAGRTNPIKKTAATKRMAKAAAKRPTKRAAGPAVTKSSVRRAPAPAPAGARGRTQKAPAKKASAKKALPVKKQPAVKKMPAVKKAPAVKKPPVPAKAPAKTRPKKVVLDKFLLEQRASLIAEREQHIRQADVLQAEADRLALDMEPGDVQFDEESGEGATMNVERERDLTLSAQARAAVDEIDRALAKIERGTYGLCEQCGQPIPKPRLKALPYAALCVNCKSGGLSRR